MHGNSPGCVEHKYFPANQYVMILYKYDANVVEKKGKQIRHYEYWK